MASEKRLKEMACFGPRKRLEVRCNSIQRPVKGKGGKLLSKTLAK